MLGAAGAAPWPQFVLRAAESTCFDSRRKGTDGRVNQPRVYVDSDYMKTKIDNVSTSTSDKRYWSEVFVPLLQFNGRNKINRRTLSDR